MPSFTFSRSFLLLLTLLAAGCGRGGPRRAPAFSGRMDLLLVVDDSAGMGPEQRLFARAAAELVGRLANPLCVDTQGQAVVDEPADPLAPCPSGSSREFPAATDLNVGVIGSSLGGLGSDSCPASETTSCPDGSVNATQDGRAHLRDRRGPCTTDVVPTWKGGGFLAWDPGQGRTPTGESVLGTPDGAAGLLPAVRDLVLGVGVLGCRFPMPLEAAYRFLADPDPYEAIAVGRAGAAEPSGTNPITGDNLAPPTADDDANQINGREFTPAAVPDGLQYACVFDLESPRLRGGASVRVRGPSQRAHPSAGTRVAGRGRFKRAARHDRRSGSSRSPSSSGTARRSRPGAR